MIFFQRRSVCHANHKRCEKSPKARPEHQPAAHDFWWARCQGRPLPASLKMHVNKYINALRSLVSRPAAPARAPQKAQSGLNFGHGQPLCLGAGHDSTSLLTTFNGDISKTRLAGSTVCRPRTGTVAQVWVQSKGKGRKW